MMERTKGNEQLSSQIRRRVESSPKEKKAEFDGNTEIMISTGSTLLDLEISGGVIEGGGLPGGILVEIFGPSGTGKTVLLSEIAGNIQKQGGEIKFHDPEARLNEQFAKLFGLKLAKEDYSRPDTVPEVFEPIKEWKPKSLKVINGLFADSLAALSTDMEMDKEDKMGGRRAKEFSEQLRKTCRILAKKNYLMVCSNQIRENMNAGPFEEKYTTPGGVSIAFYSSLRLRTSSVQKIKKSLSDDEDEGEEKKKKKRGDERVIGIRIWVEVYKNSIWRPYGSAPITIFFDYGIDDIRENLQFIKEQTKSKVYKIGEFILGSSMEKAIAKIEEDGLEKRLKKHVIELWKKREDKFKTERKPRHV